jgi:hypothetical protein
VSSSARDDPANAGGVLLALALQRSYELVWRPPAGLRGAWRPLVLLIGMAVDLEAASLLERLAPGSAEGPGHLREVSAASAGLPSLC